MPMLFAMQQSVADGFRNVRVPDFQIVQLARWLALLRQPAESGPKNSPAWLS